MSATSSVTGSRVSVVDVWIKNDSLPSGKTGCVPTVMVEYRDNRLEFIANSDRYKNWVATGQSDLLFLGILALHHRTPLAAEKLSDLIQEMDGPAWLWKFLVSDPTWNSEANQ